jgi:hypothetical protein
VALAPRRPSRGAGCAGCAERGARVRGGLHGPRCALLPAVPVCGRRLASRRHWRRPWGDAEPVDDGACPHPWCWLVRHSRPVPALPASRG